MNSPAQFIVYDTEEALHENDPVHCHRCTSIVQALAVAHKRRLDPATHITPLADKKQVIFFSNLDELCWDVLRNHAPHFSIKSDLHDGYPETIALSMNRNQLFSWILAHVDELEMLSYSFDYHTHQGKYAIGNVCETFIIQELVES